MYPNPLYLLILLGLGLSLLSACGDSTEDNDAPQEDSVWVSVPRDTTALPQEAPSVAPLLVGAWELQQMWVDGNLMSAEEIGTNYLEFTSEGQVTLLTPGLDPASSTFNYQDPLILSEALEGPREVLELTEDQLVLLESVDGTEVRYVYERQE